MFCKTLWQKFWHKRKENGIFEKCANNIFIKEDKAGIYAGKSKSRKSIESFAGCQ